MVIQSPIGRSTADGDGQETRFLLGFSVGSTPNIPPEEVLSVYILENGVQTKLVFNTDYTIELNPDAVVFSVAPSVDAKITFLLQPEDIQTTEYSTTGEFPAKSHEAALDYIQRTNIKQSDILGRSPTLYESAELQDPFDPVGQGGFVSGVSFTEDSWELFDPLLLGGITPPDVTDPLKFNRALQMVDVDSVTGKAVLDVQPLLYLAPDFTMTGTLEVTDRGKFGGQLAIGGAFTQTIYGETHRLEFLAGSEDIRFDMDPTQQSVAGALAIFNKNGSFWELTTERKLFVEGTGIAINRLLKVQSPQQPYQVGGSSLSDDGTIVRSDVPISAKERLEISGTSTVNIIRFTQTNGNYTTLYDIDQSIAAGVLGFTTSGGVTTVKGVDANIGDLPLYPNATINAIPAVESIAATGNPRLRDSGITDTATNTNFTKITRFATKDIPTEFRNLTFGSTSNGINFVITGEGFIKAVNDGSGGTDLNVEVLQNLINWPAATVGRVPAALTVVGGDVTLEDTSISYAAGNISVTGNTYLENLFLLSATQGKLSIIPNTLGNGDVEIDVNNLANGETKLLSMSRNTSTYTIQALDAQLDGYVQGNFQTPNSILKSAVDNTALETTLTEDSGSLTVPISVITPTILLGANESEFTDDSPTKVKVTYKIDKEGFGRFTETAPDEYDFVPVDISGGIGDVSWDTPTQNYVPKMDDVANKVMVNSDIVNDGTGVIIDSSFFIADSGTANNHEISFSPDQNLDVEFGDLTQGGVIIADYAPLASKATFRAIGNPSGIGDVLYPNPSDNRIAKVGNAAAKELQNSNITDDGVSVVIDSDLVVDGFIGSSTGRLLLEANEFTIPQDGNVAIDLTGTGLAAIDGDSIAGYRIYNTSPLEFIHETPTSGVVPIVNSTADKYEDSSISEDIDNVIINKDTLIPATLSADAIETDSLLLTGKEISFSTGSDNVELDFQAQVDSPITKVSFAGGVSTLSEGYTDAIDNTIPLYSAGDFTNSSLTEDTDVVISAKKLRAEEALEITSISRIYSLTFSSLISRNYVFDCERDGLLSATRSGDTVIITSGASGGGGDGDVALPIPEQDYYTRVSRVNPKELASGYLRDDRGEEAVYSEKRMVVLNDSISPSLVLSSATNKGLMLYQDIDNNMEFIASPDRGKVTVEYEFSEAATITEGLVEAQVKFENGRAVYSLDVIPKAIRESNIFFEDNGAGFLNRLGSLTSTQTYGANPVTAIFEEKLPLASATYEDITVKRSGIARRSTVALSTIEIDFSRGNYIEVQLQEDVEITVPDLGVNATFCTLVIQTPAAGLSSIITWNGNIVWENGEPFTAEFISPVPSVAVQLIFFWDGTEYLAYINSDFKVSSSGRTIVYQGDFDERYIANHDTGLQYVLGQACFDGDLNNILDGVTIRDSIFRSLYYTLKTAQAPAAGEFEIPLSGGLIEIDFDQDTVITFEPPINANWLTSTMLHVRRTALGDFDLTFTGARLTDEDSEFLSENVGELDVFEIVYIGRLNEILVSRVNQRPDPNPPFKRQK